MNPLPFFRPTPAWRHPAVLLVLTLLLASGVRLRAHDPGLSSATVRVLDDGLDIELVLSVQDATALAAPGGDGPGTTAATEAALARLAHDAFRIQWPGQTGTVALAACRIDDRNNANVHLEIAGNPAGRLTIQARWLALVAPGHRLFLTAQDAAGTTLSEALLGASQDSLAVELPAHSTPTPGPGPDTSVVARPASRPTSIVTTWRLLGLGVEHLVTGWDHLLFLFCLLLGCGGTGAAARLVTAFTLGHSASLALATLQLVPVPPSVVEPLIAASIVLVALENLRRGGQSRERTFVIFGFGLLHGLGFASVLRDLGIGTGGTGLALPLLSFNLGLELGQLLVAAILLPLLFHLRRHPEFTRSWAPACSGLAALAGIGWFVARL